MQLSLRLGADGSAVLERSGTVHSKVFASLSKALTVAGQLASIETVSISIFDQDGRQIDGDFGGLYKTVGGLRNPHDPWAAALQQEPEKPYPILIHFSERRALMRFQY